MFSPLCASQREKGNLPIERIVQLNAPVWNELTKRIPFVRFRASQVLEKWTNPAGHFWTLDCTLSSGAVKKFGWAHEPDLVGTRCSVSVLGFPSRTRSNVSLPSNFSQLQQPGGVSTPSRVGIASLPAFVGMTDPWLHSSFGRRASESGYPAMRTKLQVEHQLLGRFELEANRDMIGALTERIKTFEMRTMEWQRSITRKTQIWFI